MERSNQHMRFFSFLSVSTGAFPERAHVPRTKNLLAPPTIPPPQDVLCLSSPILLRMTVPPDGMQAGAFGRC